MSKKTSEAMLNDLFAEINNLILPADLSQTAPPPAGFVTMSVPGTTVVASDFDPQTQEGKNRLYAFMDRLPALNKQYVDSTKRCSDMYAQILSATPPEDNPAKAAQMEQVYQDALAFLTPDIIDRYEQYQEAYFEARINLCTLQNDPKATETQTESAQQKVTRARNRWVSLGQKQLVEEKLGICSAYRLCTPKAVFAEANRVYEEAKNNVTGLYPVSCTPSDWATDPKSLSWAQVTIKHNSAISKIHESTKQIDSSFSANFSWGLWSASAAGGYQERIHNLNKSSQVDNLGLSFEIARVELRRDWFKGSLLTYPGTTIAGRTAGSLCAGSLKDAAHCDLPFVPTAFVIARNITIYNEFSSEERALFEESKSWSADVSVGYGPFSIGNKTSVSSDLTDDEKKEFGDSIKISIGQGMQIIGFVNTILTPPFPSKSASNDLARGLDAVGSANAAMLSMRMFE